MNPKTNRQFSARRLPKQPGPAAWNAILPPQDDPISLVGSVTADIAIIGAGFAGLSAARRLLQIDPKLNIAILEADRVGEGPAGRNSGFMIDLPHDLSSESYAGATEDKDRLETRLNRFAIDFAHTFAQEYSLSKEVFDQRGKMNAAASQKGDQNNREYAGHLEQMGEPYSWLDEHEMRDITGGDYYRSGLYTPGSAILQPAAYIRALAGSLGDGASLFELSAVLNMEEQSDGWNLTTREGQVSARNVILANNGHAESFGFFRRRLMHVFTFAAMTEAFPESRLGGRPVWEATPSDPMGTTVRRIDDQGQSRLLVRSRFTYNPSMTVSERAFANVGRLLDKKFYQRFSPLNDLKMAYRWGGHLCLSRNAVPAHGEVAKGVFAAVCQNGLGVTKGTLSGISAAETVAGLTTPITEAMTTMAQPEKLPPEPLTWIGANSLLRWKEWRAGAE